jgi:hypothetical protein
MVPGQPGGHHRAARGRSGPAELDTSRPGLLEQALERPLLVDLEETEIGGRPARRALVHHTTETGAVTMEQWTLMEGALGYTLTASAGTLEYDDLADLFATVAAGFRPDPGFTP